MKKALFEKIKKKHGRKCSWAIWDESDVKNTDIIGKNLGDLRPDIVMVALNPSIKVSGTFANFHLTDNDHKLSYAINNSPYRGAYLTDIIKEQVEGSSAIVAANLTVEKEREYIHKLQKELADLGSETSLIVGLGGLAYRILNRHLKDTYAIKGIYHYSYRFRGYHCHKKYRSKVLAQLR